MKGLGVSSGIGIGKAFIIDKSLNNITINHIDDIEKEIDRLKSAIETAKNELDEL